MAAYIVATVSIRDPDRFSAYGRKIAGLSDKFGGEPVVRGQVAEILEGTGHAGERVVVTRFPDAEAARRYIASPEYQDARREREGAADVVMRLLID